ncbi:MAG: polysaccharide biosynthesis C-terminal domain-containing protein [Symbiobacteriia bacterium]
MIPRRRIADERGWLLKVLAGNEESLSESVGEVYVVMAEPRHTRGAHYHNVASEWFTPLAGRLHVQLVEIGSGERESFVLDADEPVTLHVPAGIAHGFFNDGSERAVLVAYASHRYQPEDTIPFPM